MSLIGFDARLWRHTGIGRYIRNLLPRLNAAGAAKGLSFAAWVHPAEMEAASEAFPGVALRPCPAAPMSPRELFFWPHELKRFRVNLFHAPHLNVPLNGPPLVVTLHDLIPLRFPGTINSRAGELYFRWMSRFAARRGDRILVHAAHPRDEMVELLGADPKKLRIVPLGADASFARAQSPERVAALRERLGLTGPYLLYTGQWKPYKNLETLLRAFARLRERHGGLQLAIAGREDPSQPHVPALMRELGLQGAALTTGFLPDDDLAALYQGARAFAFPSRAEGFGLPPLEAMAAGVPVVCSSAGPLPETVGDAAILVPPLDVLEWEAAIERVLCDEPLRSRLIQAGACRVRTLSWDTTARLTLAVYMEILQGMPL